MQKEGHHSVSLWVVAFALTAGLQIFRGSVSDTIIFTLGTFLITFAGFVPKNWDLPTVKQISNLQLSIAFVLVGMLLVLFPLHSVFTTALVIVVLPAAILLAWGTHRGPKKPASKRVKRARLLWVSWAVLTCIWEFTANILGQLHNTHTAYPTISILIVPLLDTILGQAGFVAVWVLVGLSLIRIGRKP
jgi:hypothetical protein